MTISSLNKLIELEKDAILFGFEWPNQKAIIKQAINECIEIQEAIDMNESSDRIQEEIGDLMHASISLCLFSGFNVEETLNKFSSKFEHRMNSVKLLAKKLGLNSLQGQSTEFMLKLWDEAKKLDQNNEIT